MTPLTINLDLKSRLKSKLYVCKWVCVYVVCVYVKNRSWEMSLTILYEDNPSGINDHRETTMTCNH